MSLIEASLPLLVGQASVAQQAGQGELSAAEVQQSLAQSQSLEEMLKSREQIQKPPAQDGPPVVNDQGGQDAPTGRRRRRRRKKQIAEAKTAKAADPLDRRIVDLEI